MNSDDMNGLRLRDSVLKCFEFCTYCSTDFAIDTSYYFVPVHFRGLIYALLTYLKNSYLQRVSTSPLACGNFLRHVYKIPSTCRAPCAFMNTCPEVTVEGASSSR